MMKAVSEIAISALASRDRIAPNCGNHDVYARIQSSGPSARNADRLATALTTSIAASNITQSTRDVTKDGDHFNGPLHKSSILRYRF